MGTSQASRTHFGVAKVAGATALVVGVAAAVVLAPLAYSWRGGSRTVRLEGRGQSYRAFLGLVGIDRWGLNGTREVDYQRVSDASGEDDFIRAEMSLVGFEVSLNLFRDGLTSSDEVRDSLPDPNSWSRRERPAWWDTTEPSDLIRRVFLRPGKSGTLWEYRPASGRVQIWDWLDAERAAFDESRRTSTFGRAQSA